MRVRGGSLRGECAYPEPMRAALVTLPFWLCLLHLATAAAGPDRAAGFQRWSERWASSRHGVVDDRWTADLDEDGIPDLVAHVCLPAPELGAYGHPGAYLVEDGQQRRSGLRHETGDYNTEEEPCRRDRGQVRVTAERIIDHNPTEKRETSEAKLALRDGKLVVVAQRSGSFHIPDHFSYTDVSWTELTTAHEHGHYTEGKTDDDAAKEVYELRRRETVLLVTAEATPTATQLVRGSTDGPADASLAVSVTQPDHASLEVAVTLVDDVLVNARSRKAADLDAADHVAVWLGTHAVRLARDETGWFSTAGRVVASEPLRVVVRLPAAWAAWAADTFHDIDGWWRPVDASSGTPERSNDEAWRGSLVVAFADVDAPGGERAVLSTAPIPKEGEPHGILVKLPRAARWPTSATDLGPL